MQRLLAPLLAGALLATAAAEEAIRVQAGRPMDLASGDDLARLQHLAAGVGWEFEPDATTTAGLKRLGVRTIRCINVEPLEGVFTPDGGFAIATAAGGKFLKRLHAHLDTCRAVGAQPHIILGTSLPPELRVPIAAGATGPGIMGQNGHARVFGPTDPERYISYLEACITHVMVDQGFAGARFEYGNEPDIHGQFPFPRPPLPGMGSRALFDGYVAAYRLAAAAADRVQRRHPSLRVSLGGPALAWAYTYRFGDLNWSLRFIEECAAQRLRLDFLGLHFYGNVASLDGAYPSDGGYPPFTGMLAAVIAARDRHLPGLPICISEWGPSYHGAANPSSSANSDSLGAAWSLAFLDLLVQSPVESALYLTTTDLRRKRADGGWDNVFGWPALFTNPTATGGAWPKAPFHAFDLVARLRGRRVEATRPGGGVGCFAAADPAQRTLRVLAWNSDPRLPESGAPVERAQRRLVPVEVVDAATFFAGARVTVASLLLSPAHGDAYAAHRRGEALDAASTALAPAATGELAVVDGRLATLLDLPRSSVALIEFHPIP